MSPTLDTEERNAHDHSMAKGTLKTGSFIALLLALLMTVSPPASAQERWVTAEAEIGATSNLPEVETGLLVGARIGVTDVYMAAQQMPFMGLAGTADLFYDARTSAFRTGITADAWLMLLGLETGLLGEVSGGRLRPGGQLALKLSALGLFGLALRSVYIPSSADSWRLEFTLQGRLPVKSLR